MEQIFLFSSIAGIIAIIYGFITAKQVLKMPSGEKNERNCWSYSRGCFSLFKKTIYYYFHL